MAANGKHKIINGKILLFVILAAAALIYMPTLKNDFVQGWDDEGQVVKNPDIKKLTAENIKTIFSSFYVGMYQPVTTLTYAVDYSISELNPKAYHRTNLLLHLINIVLVFFFFRRLAGSDAIAIAVAAFFAVHPLNVESVAWISARSNLLYTAFYLLALMAYLRFTENKKPLTMAAVFAFFVLSLFSKATAVTLPAVLLLLDLFLKNKITIKNLLWKLPFFALSAVFIAIAFNAREEFSHISDVGKVFGGFQQAVLLAYSLAYYVFSFFVPANLSAIHYYPMTNGVADLGITHYAGAAITVAAAVAAFKFIIDAFRKRDFSSPVLFGFLFFVITISVVIHFVPVGIQLVAERYVYLPYTGLVFMISSAVLNITGEKRKSPNVRYIIIAAAVVFTVFAFITYKTAGKWKNTNTLMSDVIKNNPDAAHAYLVRADGKYLTGKYREALDDYAIAIRMAPNYETSYINRANVYAALGNYNAAVADLTTAIGINGKNPTAYFNRGLAQANAGNYRPAVADFDKALALRPGYGPAMMYRGISKGATGNFTAAVSDLEKATRLTPRNPQAWFNLGVALTKMKRYDEAVKSYSAAIKLNPGNSSFYLQRGIAALMKGNTSQSCNDFRMAVKLGNSKAREFAGKYCR